MIRHVQAVSLEKMKVHKSMNFSDSLFAGCKVAVISVVNTDFEPIFATEPHVLALQIDDTYPSSPWKLIGCDNSREMTMHQAERVLDFIMAHHHCADDYFLLINCHMGQSRSGAIARFTMEYCGIDDASFTKLNPNIAPNEWIKNLLYHAYNLKFQYGATAPVGMQNAFIPQKTTGEF